MAKNFPCPSCNADLEWSPGSGDLTCPYCGHVVKDEAPEPTTAGGPPAAYKPMAHFISEVDSWMRDNPGWGEAKKEIACGSCGASSEVEPHIEATSCPFCGSHQLTPNPSKYDALRPDAVAPFRIERGDAQRKFREWLGGLWFRPSGLKEMAALGSVQGIYLPVWSIDAKTDTGWTAEKGTHYYETVKEKDDNGNTVERKEQKTKWSSASGRHSQQFDDVMINGSTGIEQELFQTLQPFPLDKLTPYSPKFLQGFVAERYQKGLDEGYELAKKIMEEVIEEKCEEKVGGDEVRNLEIKVRYYDGRFKLLLLPIWVAAYQYDGKPHRYLVNGLTGEASGTAPYSTAKIVGLIVAILAALATIVLLAR